MLSPREFATLMLLKDAPDQIDPDRADLEALLERQLITLKSSCPGNGGLLSPSTVTRFSRLLRGSGE